MCVSTWETTLESLQFFKYTVNTMQGSPPHLHTLFHVHRLRTSGLPVLTEVTGVEKADDELWASVVDNTMQPHLFVLIYRVTVGPTEE